MPESPRWLFIHGREDEGEEIVRDIEHDGRGGDRRGLPDAEETITIRQRKIDRDGADRQDGLHAVPEAHGPLLLAVRRPGVPLQRVLLHLRRHPDHVPRRRARPAGTSRSFAVSNFIGALLLSPLFDTRGPGADDRRHLHRLRACCSASAGFFLGGLNAVTLTVFGVVIFFFASAGASAAYLTASEVFPMETRALCIAFFYAIGTAIGGITGPLLFGWLIDNASASGDITEIAVGYFIGASLMIIGGMVEASSGSGRRASRWRTSPNRSPRRRAEGPRTRDSATSDLIARSDHDGRVEVRIRDHRDAKPGRLHRLRCQRRLALTDLDQQMPLRGKPSAPCVATRRTTHRPSGPPSKAVSGSWKRASDGISRTSSVGTYGAFTRGNPRRREGDPAAARRGRRRRARFPPAGCAGHRPRRAHRCPRRGSQPRPRGRPEP